MLNHFFILFLRKVTQTHLYEIFGTYGKLDKVGVMESGKKDFRKGNTVDCFIMFNDEASARHAVRYMNGGIVDGRSLRVRLGREMGTLFLHGLRIPSLQIISLFYKIISHLHYISTSINLQPTNFIKKLLD